jgi:protein O-GlcNAc transferase
MSQPAIFREIAKEIDNKNLSQALTMLQDAAQQFGKSFDVYLFAGVIDYHRGLLLEAVESFEKALEISPNNQQALFNLGSILCDLSRYSDAMSMFNRLLKLNPTHMATLIKVSAIFDVTGNPSSCEQTCRIILKIQPTNVSGLNNLGNACKNCGKSEESLIYYKKALEINNTINVVRSNLLFATNYQTMEREKQFLEHCRVASYWDNPQPLLKTREKNSKIKVGFVSADFYTHSVSYFLEGVFKNYNREEFEFYGFSNTEQLDDTTERLIDYCTGWENIRGLSDEDAYKKIQDHNIDILVDLSGHTGQNRLSLFGLKPAPCAITWLGYPNTTGLKTIDYRITDEISDPQGADKFYTEELIRLPNGFLSYTPPKNLPVPNLSSLENREETVFGSFNNIAKLSVETITLWSTVIKSVPNSKMIVKHKNFNDPRVRERYLGLFLKNGVTEKQLIFKEYSFAANSHLEIYNEVDIALDSFPYNGTTTTFEAALMGVPTITLEGESHASRVGASINIKLGLPQFVAQNPEQFLEIALNFSQNKEKLLELKYGLREKLLNSPLSNSKDFTRELEKAFKFAHNYKSSF